MAWGDVFWHTQLKYALRLRHMHGTHTYAITSVKKKRGVWPPWTWWRDHMETFSALLAICAGNSPVSGEFPALRPVTRTFDILFDLRLNKPLSKQSWDCDLRRYRAHHDVIVMNTPNYLQWEDGHSTNEACQATYLMIYVYTSYVKCCCWLHSTLIC